MSSRFVTTSWTQVLAARETRSHEARHALETLCATYWYPIYAFVRRQGYEAEDSRDLTQSYFAQLLEKDYLSDYQPSLGRFRVFLKTSVKNFLAKEREKRRTWKRGGKVRFVSLHAEDGEQRYRFEPVDHLTPEELFERQWAFTVLEHALTRLRAEFIAAGRKKELDKLMGFLTDEEGGTAYRHVADELGITEGGVRSAVHRLRRKFGEVLRQEIADTVANPSEVDDELKHLLRVST